MEKEQRELGRDIITIALTAFLITWALRVGDTGDDFIFHVTSWQEYLTDWNSGVLVPAWAAHANFGYGEPRFLFYPPLSIALGSIITFACPTSYIPQIYCWTCLVLAGLAMRKLAGLLTSGNARRDAAMLYITSFYIVICVLVRFAAAELLASAILPLVLFYFCELLLNPTAAVGCRFAAASALIWLSNEPAAIVTFYSLCAAALTVAFVRRQVRFALIFAACECGALLLSSFYLLPALEGQKFVTVHEILQNSWTDNLPFQPTKFPFYMLNLPLWIWGALCATSNLIFLVRTRSLWREKPIYVALFGISIFVTFVQTGFSRPLWIHLPKLAFVQFPFRFDVFLCTIGSLLLPKLLPNLTRHRPAVYGCWLAAACIPIAVRLHHHYEGIRPMTVSAVAEQVRESYRGNAEYGLAGKNFSKFADLPLSPIISDDSRNCSFLLHSWLPQKVSFSTSSPFSCRFMVRLAPYRFWAVTIDGRSLESSEMSERLAFETPPGVHNAEIVFRRPGSSGVQGTCISVVTFVASVLICVRTRYRTQNYIRGT